MMNFSYVSCNWLKRGSTGYDADVLVEYRNKSIVRKSNRYNLNISNCDLQILDLDSNDTGGYRQVINHSYGHWSQHDFQLVVLRDTVFCDYEKLTLLVAWVVSVMVAVVGTFGCTYTMSKKENIVIEENDTIPEADMNNTLQRLRNKSGDSNSLL